MHRPILKTPVALLLAATLWSGAASAAEEFLLSRWIQPVPRYSVLTNVGYYVWGGSVVEDAGRYHMFYSRWSTNDYAWADGWLFNSEIGHAVSTNASGPFVFTGVVLGKRTNDDALAFWDSQTQHNPHIRRFGSRFYLYYMAAVDPGTNAWPGVNLRNRIQRNQRIGVISANSIQDLLDGNFERPNSPIISPVYSTNAATDRTTNPTDYAGNRIVNNETVIQRPDGKYQLIYKSNWPQSPSYGHGFALADDPAGPFTLLPGPIFSDQGREDENHFYDAATGKYYLIVKNFSKLGTEQLVSNDSTNWTSQGMQLGTMIRWADAVSESLQALERPQLLRDSNGLPVMLYMAARRGLPGGAVESFNVHIPLRQSPARASVVTNAANVKASGRLVSAVNFGATSNAVINGMQFAASGTSLATLTATYGLTQTGGAGGATLSAGLTDSAYDGLPEFEDWLDTSVSQTGAATAAAKLQFNVAGLLAGRTYRLQLFFGETRPGIRHGPQTVEVGGDLSAPFDYGPASSLVTTGATAVKAEMSWIASRSSEAVTLTQGISSGNGLVIPAFALHDVTPPLATSIAPSLAGGLTLTWQVAPGFWYSVWRSDDLQSWAVASSNTFIPVGPDLINYSYTTTSISERQGFFRLTQFE
jgi:hypothetical protein